MRRPHRLRSRAGVTILQLTVILVLLAVLFAVLWPKVRNFIEKTSMSEGVTGAMSIATLAEMHMSKQAAEDDFKAFKTPDVFKPTKYWTYDIVGSPREWRYAITAARGELYTLCLKKGGPDSRLCWTCTTNPGSPLVDMTDTPVDPHSYCPEGKPDPECVSRCSP